MQGKRVRLNDAGIIIVKESEVYACKDLTTNLKMVTLLFLLYTTILLL